jgi:DNA-binding winged helix-turn-helix (wHTH) protein
VQHTVYKFDGFQLDVSRRMLVSAGGLVLPLSSRAMDTLLLLVANAGELVDKQRIMLTVWPKAVVEDNNLNQCIASIRKALGEKAGSNRYVMTVPGRGYCFVCPVVVASHESKPLPADRVQTSPRLPLVLAWLITAGAAVLGWFALPAGRPATITAPSSPEVVPSTLVLRLHPVAARTIGLNAPAPAAPTHCLSQKPGMKLRVLVELVAVDEAAPVWSGEYTAGAEDILGPHEESPPGDGKLCDG